MSRKIFIVIVIILVLALGIGAYVLFFSKSSQNQGSVGQTIKDFFPFGKGGGSTTNPPPPETVTSGGENPPPPETPLSKIRQISRNPVAGYTLFLKDRLVEVPAPVTDTVATTNPEMAEDTEITVPETPKTTPEIEKAVTVRYMERGSGNIFDTFADNGTEARISNTTVPHIYDALFGNIGQSVLLRNLAEDNRTITSFLATVPKEIVGGDGPTEGIKGSFLEANLFDVSASPDGKHFFSLSPFSNTVIGTVRNSDGTKKTDIFESPYIEWLSNWIDNKVVALQTKASGISPGYLYSLDTTTKKSERILGNITGLTALVSPNGKLVLYSQSGQNSITLYLYNRDTRITNRIDIQTLPEKCVWRSDSSAIFCGVPRELPSALYPDIWYQGVVNFSDTLWVISAVDTPSTLELSPLSEVGAADIVNLKIDETGSYLLFIDKNTGLLWEYSLL